MATRLKRYLKSFTLIELIIVIAIIAVLGATAFLLLTQWMSKGRDATKISTIRTIKTALDINYTARGDYPIPEDAVEHTASNGTKLYQGYVGGNMIAELQRTPIDPTTKKPYIYSYMKPTGSVGYYQIGTTIENTVGYEGYNLAKADIVQTAKIIGNYEFDPSLPSLIIVGGNETTKGIYDPSNCYVLDGGKNTVDGAQCQPKKDMPLKDYDNGLVGYWDMESLTDDGKLMDISGNGNHGVFSGGLSYLGGITGSILGSGLFFDGYLNHILVPDKSDGLLDLELGDFSINFVAYYVTGGALFNGKPNYRVFSKGYAWNYNAIGYEVGLGGFNGQILGTTNKGYGSADSRRYAFVQDQSKYLKDSTYYLITINFKRNDNISIYVNGNYLASGSKNAGYDFVDFKDINLNSPKDLIIGVRIGEKRGFRGTLDEIKIYKRALSEAEILQQAKIAGF